MSKKITLILTFALFAVSTSSLIVRWLEFVPAISMAFWRMAIGSALLWFFSFYKPQGKLTQVDRKLTSFAGIFLGLHFAFFFGALKLISIANATFLATLAPIFTLLIEKYFYKRKLNSKIILGILLALIGAVIISGNNFDISSKQSIGNILALLSSVWFSITIMISERVRESVSIIAYSRLLFCTAAITLFLLAIINKDNIVYFSLQEYFGLALLGIIPTILGHNLFYYALKYTSPTAVATFPLGEPIIASILAWIIFGEIAGINIFIGGIITLSGLLIITRK